jgi:diazepam-binding inhibitor (GABA receptor modulating acyl-CoA-binding protein)
MDDLDQQFAAARARVKPLTGLGNDVMLDIYALYKQSTVGDVSGQRPGMMDLRGRAKYDAWVGKRGMAKDAAKQAYIAVVARVVP